MRTGAISLLVGAAVLAAADQPVGPVTAKTADVEITARVIADAESQKAALGSDLNRQYVVVELTVKPRGGYPVTLGRDDFLLRSERDNERATADSPDRIAGAAVLVLGSSGSSRPVYSESGDPVYVGGIPGTGTGPPRRINAPSDTFGGGGGTGGATTLSAAKEKPTPLLETLRRKELPLGETGRPVSGYLYFSVDPKQKIKNFHLHYKGPTERADLRFK